MGILQLYPPNEFYRSINRQEFHPGQFCWLPVPHPDPIPRILDIERSHPTEHYEVKFNLRNANLNTDFTRRDRILPIKSLNLQSNEELLAQKAKRRPGIIIAAGMDCFPEIDSLLRKERKKHLQQDCLFVIPIYSIKTNDDPGGFPPEMVSRIRCLIFRQFFYFPSNSRFREGIARFDRIQVVVSRDPAAIAPEEVCLSDDVFKLFLGMFMYCISGTEDEDIRVSRSIVKEAYNSKNNPNDHTSP